MVGSLVLSSVIAAAGVIVAALAFWVSSKMHKETVLLREAQTEPGISLHLEIGRHLNLMNLVVQNYGQAPAFDLKWDVTPPLKELEQHQTVLPSLALLNGFEHMAPKQRFETFFGAATELIASKCPSIKMTVHYKNSRGQAKSESYTLNPAQYAGMRQCGEPAQNSIARSLEKIAGAFNSVTSGGRVRIAASPGRKPWEWQIDQMFKQVGEDVEQEKRDVALSQSSPGVELEHFDGRSHDSKSAPDSGEPRSQPDAA